MSTVLHINAGGDLGGGKSHLVALLPELRRMGVDAQLLVFSEGVLAGECRAKGVPVHCLGSNTLVSPRLLSRLTAFLTRTRPAVVHTHGGRATFYGRLAARCTGVPRVVTTVHSHAGLDHEAAIKSALFSLADRLTWHLTHSFIAVSEQLGGDLRKRGIPANRLQVIPNGIAECSWPAVERAGLGLSLTDPLVCSAGRFVELKGFDLLLKAAAILRSEGLRFQLLLIGDGPQRAQLEKLCDGLKLTDMVRFMGYVHNGCSFIAASDLLVLASRMEGQPIVLLEAMAAGVPVVATSVGGVPEIIFGGRNGLLIPPDDAGALARAIRDVLTDSSLASRLGRAGRDWYEAHGTAVMMAAATARCYGGVSDVSR